MMPFRVDEAQWPPKRKTVGPTTNKNTAYRNMHLMRKQTPTDYSDSWELWENMLALDFKSSHIVTQLNSCQIYKRDTPSFQHTSLMTFSIFQLNFETESISEYLIWCSNILAWISLWTENKLWIGIFLDQYNILNNSLAWYPRSFVM